MLLTRVLKAKNVELAWNEQARANLQIHTGFQGFSDRRKLLFFVLLFLILFRNQKHLGIDRARAQVIEVRMRFE